MNKIRDWISWNSEVLILVGLAIALVVGVGLLAYFCEKRSAALPGIHIPSPAPGGEALVQIVEKDGHKFAVVLSEHGAGICEIAQ